VLSIRGRSGLTVNGKGRKMAETDLKRVDYEPYFEMWNSVLFYPNPDAKENEILLAGHRGDLGSLPCHQHKTCGGLIKAVSKYPPRVCVHCKADTAQEINYA
jgi:hypothetical protein